MKILQLNARPAALLYRDLVHWTVQRIPVDQPAEVEEEIPEAEMVEIPEAEMEVEVLTIMNILMIFRLPYQPLIHNKLHDKNDKLRYPDILHIT
jgi:hypothetical protein